MTFQIAMLLALIGVALVFFAFDWVSADVVAIGLMLTLVLTGLVPAQKAFAGFGSDSVILILGLLILTAALLKSGVMELVGRPLVRYTGDRPFPLEPSCLMVYGPGRYRFRDFLKVGSLLTILIFLVAIVLVPRVWPLK